MQKRPLLGLPKDVLEEIMVSLGEKKFRAKQVLAALYQGQQIDEMTVLSQGLRQTLSEQFVSFPMSIHTRYVSAMDGTVKYLYRLMDGNMVEGVFMHYAHGNTHCISSQVGCNQHCKFCASTIGGKTRDLTAEEMLSEVICANKAEADGQRAVTNVVIMGVGEPLDNYDNVVRFLRLLNDPEGLAVSLRNVSLSTCGLVPKINALAEEGLSVNLAISLHAPNDEIRKQIMPIANQYSIDQVMSACRDYVKKTGRRLIVEYAMIDGLNDEIVHAQELANRLRGLQCHVNLIPLNAVKEYALKPSSHTQIKRFSEALEQAHISVTIRRELGTDIAGACGQLRKRHIKPEQEV